VILKDLGSDYSGPRIARSRDALSGRTAPLLWASVGRVCRPDGERSFGHIHIFGARGPRVSTGGSWQLPGSGCRVRPGDVTAPRLAIIDRKLEEFRRSLIADLEEPIS